MFWVLGALAAVVCALAVRALLLANEVFCIELREGRGLLVRGWAPPTLVHDLADVARRGGAASGRIRVVREGGRSQLRTEGLDATVSQRLRNVFGATRFRELQGLGPPGKRNLGQRLGWAWLAWKLER